VIENIYDRWQGRNGVTHYDGTTGSTGSGAFKPSSSDAFKPSSSDAFKPPSSDAFKPASSSAFKPPSSSAFKSAESYKGYPALYGRYQGSSRPASLSPPRNTVALNPYSRPQSVVRPGEIPHGAQLLTTLRQAPGGGRDVYASPDGGVYLRKPDGWYRRESGGQWKFAAPTQGTMERGQITGARGGAQPGAGKGYRPLAGVGSQAGPGRVPNTGFEARTHDIASLEREYYARSLAQFRAQNWQSSRSYGRPVRSGGRRR
jgi:hypothetical protein